MRLFALLALFACLTDSVSNVPTVAASKGRACRTIDRIEVTPEIIIDTVGQVSNLTGTIYKTCGGTAAMTVTWLSRNNTIASVTATSSQTAAVTSHAAGVSYIVGSITVNTTVKTDSTRIEVIDTGAAPPSGDTLHTGPQIATTTQFLSAANGSYGSSGDTLWIRGANYGISLLNITTTNRVFRVWPGEHARLVGAMYIGGANNTIWGLHVEPTTQQNLMGINVRASGTKLINNVVTRAGMTGIGFWVEAPNSEATGNIVYHNGTHGNLDHGFYVQNNTGTKLLKDNLVFDNSAYGFHLYGESGQYVRGITLRGNIPYSNGFAGIRDDIFLGSSETANGIVVDTNDTWKSDRSTYGVRLPWEYGPTHGDLTERGNYFAGKVSVPAARWTSLTQSGNTTVGSTIPGTNKIIVRANPYETGRGHVAIYNWTGATSVTVDLSSILSGGDAYRVMKPQNLWGTPVVSGTYSVPISIPTPAQFQAFVVVSP